MIWAVPPPDLTPAALNLRPVMAIVEDVADLGIVGKLKAQADDMQREAAGRRAELATSLKSLVAMLARAELDGWELDVNEPIQQLQRTVAELRDRLAALKKTMRGTITRLQAAKAPGAGTLHNSERKIFDIFADFANDLEDCLADLRAVQSRMKAYKTTPSAMTQSEAAYRRAFQTILGGDQEVVAKRDEADGILTMRLCIPVRVELLAQPDELLRQEARVHNEVALQDNRLVGRVAIDYVQAD